MSWLCWNKIMSPSEISFSFSSSEKDFSNNIFSIINLRPFNNHTCIMISSRNYVRAYTGVWKALEMNYFNKIRLRYWKALKVPRSQFLSLSHWLSLKKVEWNCEAACMKCVYCLALRHIESSSRSIWVKMNDFCESSSRNDFVHIIILVWCHFERP